MIKGFFFFTIFLTTTVSSFIPPLIISMNEQSVIQQITLKDLFKKIDSNDLNDLLVSPTLDTIVSKDSNNNIFTTKINPFIIPKIFDSSLEHNINTEFTEYQPTFWDGLTKIINVPTLFLGYLLLRSFNSAVMPPLGMFQKKEPLMEFEKPNVTFSDWAGSPEVFTECTEIVSFIKNNTNFVNAGAEIPKGILLEGSPGTGKTLLAKAIATEADAKFISISGSEFVELFIGLGAQKVRRLFQEARKYKPCIIFIDEIDAVGRQRGAGINMGNDEREQTLNQLLTEMDGFRENDQIIVIAATNRRDVLDEALLRPGRFDRIITVPLPDYNSRIKILNTHLRDKVVEGNTTAILREISGGTTGFSGASLKNLVNEAAIVAGRKGETAIKKEYIYEALEKLLVGISKLNDTRSSETINRVAIHELGHAITALMFPDYFDFKKVTIQSTYSGVGGYTLFSEPEDIVNDGLYTKDLLKKRLVVALGGKAAETIYFGDDLISQGASNDLIQANNLARQMINNFGMGKKLVVYADTNDVGGLPFLGRSLGMADKISERTKKDVDTEALELVNEAFTEACNIIKNNKNRIDKIIPLLIQKKTLFIEDL